MRSSRSSTRCRWSGSGASDRSRRGSSTGARIVTVADVAALGEAALVDIVGRAAGRHLNALAHNRDPRRIDVGRRRRSIGTQRALGRRARSPDTLDIDLIRLVDRLARRLRQAHRVSRTVTLRLRFDDFSRATRSRTLPEATADTLELLTACRVLLNARCRRSSVAASRSSASPSATCPVTTPSRWRCRSTAHRRRRSTRRSTGSRSDSARRPSRAASSLDAETACRCHSSPTDRPRAVAASRSDDTGSGSR